MFSVADVTARSAFTLTIRKEQTQTLKVAYNINNGNSTWARAGLRLRSGGCRRNLLPNFTANIRWSLSVEGKRIGRIPSV